MARVEAVIAGTGEIPSYGRSLLDEEELNQFAEQLRGQRVPMFLEHDLDQPIEVTVVSAEVRDGATGDRQLRVIYDVPDDLVPHFQTVRGMSVSFARTLFGPADMDPDSRILVDPNHFSRQELVVAAQRLNRAGFTPSAGFYFQLSEFPPPVVVFEFLHRLPTDLGWAVVAAAIIEGLRVLIHRGERTRFRFVLRREGEDVTAEIETSSGRALAEAVRALVELNAESGGLFVREQSARRWRRGGTTKRRRRGKRR